MHQSLENVLTKQQEPLKISEVGLKVNILPLLHIALQ